MLTIRHEKAFFRKLPLVLLILISSLTLFISGCQKTASGSAVSLQTTVTQPVEATELVVVTNPPTQSVETATITATSLPTSTPTELPPDYWKDLPVIPTEISDRVREIYQTGQEMGRNPRRFTKVGDCNSQHPDFLSGFDHVYYLGKYSYLQPAIDYFKGSFGILSQTTNPGMNTARVLSYLWKTEDCPSTDTLLECQYRVDNPSFSIIMLGTNDGYYHQANPESFERNMRAIIERTIELGIVPILATKVDNNEGDQSINPLIAQLAAEYEIPLWNFWRAAQPLANGGLRDHEHLNSGSGPPATDFRMDISLSYGKEMKNLTALQVLDFMMRELADPETIPTLAVTAETTLEP
jgi:hypothetical protein